MKLVCLDGYTVNPGDNPWAPVEALGSLTVYPRTPADQVLERAAEAEVLLTNKTPLTRDMIEQLPCLRFISVLATGFNVVDTKAAAEAGIVVSNVPEYSTDSVAQFVFAQLLALCRQVSHHSQAVLQGRWTRAKDFSFWDTAQVELTGLRLGIVGFGRIGQRVGALAHSFGMEVLACSRSRKSRVPYPFEWREMHDLFAEADVVSLHCPLTEDNIGFVNAERLAQMNPSAFFINTARGGLVNEADLAQALNTGQIAGAACDVVSVEPIEPGNPLLQAANILLTPHIAWATLSARRRLMAATAENIAAYQAGRPVNRVN